MEFAFSDELFEENKVEIDEEAKRKERLAYVPKQRSTKWFHDYVVSEPPTLDDCGVIKNQADLFYYQKDYSSALEKYKERLKHLVNRNNNSIIREVHTCIIHCCLRLNLNDEAQHQVNDLLKTTGNPVDSSIPILAYRVYRENQKFQEAGVYLYKCIEMNPWYPTYWLEMFDFLHYLHSNAMSYDFGGHDLPLKNDFFQLLLLHINYVATENQRSRDNKSNVKTKETILQIEECKKKFNFPDGNTEELRTLHRQMGDPRQNAGETSSITQNIVDIYAKFLFKPLREEKRQ